MEIQYIECTVFYMLSIDQILQNPMVNVQRDRECESARKRIGTFWLSGTLFVERAVHRQYDNALQRAAVRVVPELGGGYFPGLVVEGAISDGGKG